jgi:hypothetical protein
MAEDSAKIGKQFSRSGHALELVVEAEALEKQKKKADARLAQPSGKAFSIYCDEGPYLSGDDTAPPPLAYLTSAVAF